MPERIAGFEALVERILRLLDGTMPPLLVGIAGTPGAGKSTLAKRIASSLRERGHAACFCPMDGFHMDSARLEARGLLEAKGRIDTFDAEGFAAAVARLRAGEAFWWPVYSRKLHDTVKHGIRIEGGETVFVVEGNYLLTDREPWLQIAAAMDLRVYLDERDDVLRKRLLLRHERGGRSRQAAMDWVETVDMPNARAVREGMQRADILYGEDA